VLILTRDEDIFALDPDCGILVPDPACFSRPGAGHRAVERPPEVYADDRDI